MSRNTYTLSQEQVEQLANGSDVDVGEIEILAPCDDSGHSWAVPRVTHYEEGEIAIKRRCKRCGESDVVVVDEDDVFGGTSEEE